MPFKPCPFCSQPNGVRTLVCKHCNRAYPNSAGKTPLRKKRKGLKVEWTSLVAGDRIRVISGSGPYYLAEDGTKTYLTERGIYIVLRVDKNGLLCHNEKLGGDHFIYMGPKKRSPLGSNIWRKMCKIRKIG